MADPISNQPNVCNPNDFDALLHEVTDNPVRPPIPASVHVDTQVPAEAPPIDMLVDTSGDLLSEGAGVAAESVGRSVLFLGSALGPLLMLHTGLEVLAHAHEEGHRLGLLHDRDVLRGALAALESRAGDPRVVAERHSNPAFDEGFRRLDAYRGDPRRMAEVLSQVRTSMHAGAEAVVSGRDSGPEFECLYRGDIVFHHAVDYMRFAREHALPDYENARALHDQVAQQRAAVGRPA